MAKVKEKVLSSVDDAVGKQRILTHQKEILNTTVGIKKRRKRGLLHYI